MRGGCRRRASHAARYIPARQVIRKNRNATCTTIGDFKTQNARKPRPKSASFAVRGARKSRGLSRAVQCLCAVAFGFTSVAGPLLTRKTFY